MNTAVIGFGSNIEAPANIEKARGLLGQEQLTVLKASRFVTTTPVGIRDQDDFLNGSVLIETPLSCTELKDILRGIEDRLGRDRTGPKFGPRTIDLDLVIWNGEVVDQDFYKRDFVRTSVLEIMPDLKYTKDH